MLQFVHHWSHLYFCISLRLNTGVRKESNRGNGLVKEIKLILSWQQAECVWVLGHHFIAHALSLEGWFQWGWERILLIWMQPSILACQVGCMIYWASSGLNGDSWRCRRQIVFTVKSQMPAKNLCRTVDLKFENCLKPKSCLYVWYRVILHLLTSRFAQRMYLWVLAGFQDNGYFSNFSDSWNEELDYSLCR